MCFKLNHYVVVKNGNQVVFESENKKPAVSRFNRLAAKGKDYVELWYQYPSKAVLVMYAN